MEKKPLTKTLERDLLIQVNKNIEDAYQLLSQVNDFGKTNAYDNRQEKSYALDKLNDLGRVTLCVINGTSY